jgi:hypothetical protein
MQNELKELLLVFIAAFGLLIFLWTVCAVLAYVFVTYG